MASLALLMRGLILSLLSVLVIANVEKIVFVAPEAQAFPSDASIDNLLLTSLSETRPSIRTFVNASFPTEKANKGTETWMMLEDLVPGRRYELRVCWIATQPTSFWLYERSMEAVFSAPELLSSLTAYSNIRHETIQPEEMQAIRSRVRLKEPSLSSPSTFSLFLQIYAAADYFTLNKTMMDDVPPVQVDVILDPYLLNIFPKTLIPTAGYLVVIAATGWFLSGSVIKYLLRPLAAPTESSERKKRR